MHPGRAIRESYGDGMPRYWIGGSPCAGKSSIARLLADRHGLVHVECDAAAPPRLAAMAGRGLPAYDELTALGTCGRLAMPPAWQADREVAFYHEQFPYLLAELGDRDDLLVEGADLLPELLHAAGAPLARSVWVVPTPEFQRRHYRAREWVAPYLAQCPDPELAFENWMRRDVLFARHVERQAAALGGTVLVVDGSRPLVNLADLVTRHLGLR